jgi:hypothetical protein
MATISRLVDHACSNCDDDTRHRVILIGLFKFARPLQYLLRKIYPGRNDGNYEEARKLWHALGYFSPTRIARLARQNRLPTSAEMRHNLLAGMPNIDKQDLGGVNLNSLALEYNLYTRQCTSWFNAEVATEIQSTCQNQADRADFMRNLDTFHPDIQKFWHAHANPPVGSGACHFPAWIDAEIYACVFAVSSAAAERAFSLLKLILTKHRYSLLRDAVEASLMIMYNHANDKSHMPADLSYLR